jgi:MoxR-like ATPase
MLSGRDYVIPEDIQTLAPAVMAHRLGNVLGGSRGQSAEAIVRSLLDEVPAL